MDGYRYNRFSANQEEELARSQQQLSPHSLYDYRLIVGDVQEPPPLSPPPQRCVPALNCCSPLHPHGHETAAQRYIATRLQAGYEPER
ncbi:hypothetical protein NDU88_003124 [Pleurodeles waltl]|uniref:Uncharacterized protein n=1 Tax=Pleurodeles waltl TaxID=8319 RepID=A0AAV7SDL5_PLEWA|nr:hypothetical protein NDU88_003124 [Pleurodeles waltl]